MGLIIGLVSGETRKAVARAVEGEHSLAFLNSLGFLGRLIRERPVDGAVIDLRELDGAEPALTLRTFRERFQGLGIVALVDGVGSPRTLFRIGQAKLQRVEVVDVAAIGDELRPMLARALSVGVAYRVGVRLRGKFPPWNVARIVEAIEKAHLGWTVPDMREKAGLERMEFLCRFIAWGLPNPKGILAWVRVFRASHWLTDVGRTAESVARQLDYHDGAALRKALGARLASRPREMIDAGGLSFALDRFLCEDGRES